MATCNYCGGSKLTDWPCPQCGRMTNREDVEAAKAKVIGNRLKRRAAQEKHNG